MPISKEERSKILGKFADCLQELEPTELPPLANQLFSLTTNVQLVLMVLFSFQKYFHKFYYKKLFTDMETDSMTESDIIGEYFMNRFRCTLECLTKWICVLDPYPHSEKDIREAEETILYYLSKSSQYNLTEDQIVANCRVSIKEKVLNSYTFVHLDSLIKIVPL